MPSSKSYQKTQSHGSRSRFGIKKTNFKNAPILKIDEIAKKLGKKCVYELMTTHGSLQTPFNIKCTVGTSCGVGKGESENAAKLASAKALFVSMDEDLKKVGINETVDMSTEVHPIDQLNQVAAQNGWNKPTYVVNLQADQFQVICAMQGIEKGGEGFTKESAEYIAASNMLEYLSSQATSSS